MTRQTLDQLARFCAEQGWAFDPGAWRRCESLDRAVLALAAKYLSMTSWYGHETALEAIAEELRPGISSAQEFDQETFAKGFDLSYFSAALRYRIAVAGAPRRPAVRSLES